MLLGQGCLVPGLLGLHPLLAHLLAGSLLDFRDQGVGVGVHLPAEIRGNPLAQAEHEDYGHDPDPHPG